MGNAAHDQFARAGPVQTHAALGGIHGFRNLESKTPQVLAEAQGGFPVDDRCTVPWVAGLKRIHDHVRCRIGDAVPRQGLDAREWGFGMSQCVLFKRAVRFGQGQLHGDVLAKPPEDMVRGFFRDHDGRCVGVARGNQGHDRSIRDAQAFDADDAKIG